MRCERYKQTDFGQCFNVDRFGLESSEGSKEWFSVISRRLSVVLDGEYQHSIDDNVISDRWGLLWLWQVSNSHSTAQRDHWCKLKGGKLYMILTNACMKSVLWMTIMIMSSEETSRWSKGGFKVIPSKSVMRQTIQQVSHPDSYR